MNEAMIKKLEMLGVTLNQSSELMETSLSDLPLLRDRQDVGH